MEPPSPTLPWRFAVGVVRFVMRTIFRWTARTTVAPEVPPGRDAAVIVYNHTSNCDPFIVADELWREAGHWVRPMAKASLFDVPLLGTLGRAAGAIPVTRETGEGRNEAYAAAVEVLDRGGSVLIAPEGTTTHDGSLLPLRHGAARLAIQAGVPVVVVTQFGAQRGFSPVVGRPEFGAHVSLHVDGLDLVEGEDAAGLTGRIAATMIDRHAELVAAYPQRDLDAVWWPPYHTPAEPSRTARSHLEEYRESMRAAVAAARRRRAGRGDESDEITDE